MLLQFPHSVKLILLFLTIFFNYLNSTQISIIIINLIVIKVLQIINDMYYSYHNKIKSLIKEGHLFTYEIVDKWNNISPALVLYFDNHRPMPVRQHRWHEYLDTISNENKKF